MNFFLNRHLDFLKLFFWQGEKRCFLLLFALVMQSCTANHTFTSTSVVPGKLLSRNSLGFQETANRINLEEFDPYTVSVTRNICKTELISIEHQALIETRYGTQTLDCKDAYASYLGHNLTALGVPLLFDSLTGFTLFRENCLKSDPVYQIVTKESNEIIKEESLDSKTTACMNIPVANASITAKIDEDIISITTAADGVASLTPEKIEELERAVTKAVIKYKFDAVEITTVAIPKQDNRNMASIFAIDSDNMVTLRKGPRPKSISEQEILQEKNFVAALSPRQTRQSPTPNISSDNNKTVPVAQKKDVQETHKLSHLDAETVGEKNSAAAITPPPAPQPDSPQNVAVVDAVKTVPVPEKTAVTEAPKMAKIDQGTIVEKNAASVITPPSASQPESTQIVAVAEVAKTATVPETTVATEPPKMAKVEQVPVDEKVSAAAITPPPAPPPESPQSVVVVDAVKTVAAPEKTAVTETPKMAKVDHVPVDEKSTAAAITLPSAPPESPRSLVVDDSKAVPDTENTTTSETIKTARLDQDRDSNMNSPKIISTLVSPKANKSSRDVSKSSPVAPVMQRAQTSAMAKSTPKMVSSKAEFMHMQTLILSLELHKICCPLTEKLLWNFGN